MIELKNINFRYTGGTDAGGLENIDLTLPNGQVILLCGQSGCGKTTLTRLINGLIPNYYDGELTGEVLLNGENISQLPLYEPLNTLAAYFKIHGHNFLQWILQVSWLSDAKTKVYQKMKL